MMLVNCQWMFEFLKHILQRTVAWFRSERGAPVSSPKQSNPVADLLAAGLTPPVDAPALPSPPIQPNRATRRSLSRSRRHFEKQRRKFDKFVEPKGERPKPRLPTEKVERRQAGPRREDVQITDDGDNFICVDKHHSDRETKVLYELSEFYGHFNFRDTILDQIERYFFYLDRMEKMDPDSYGLYKEIGAALLPYMATPDVWVKDPDDDKKDQYKEKAKLSSWFLKTRPAFGCIAYGTNPEAERLEAEWSSKRHRWMIPRFMYFTKFSQPPYELQPMGGGDIYKVTAWWDFKARTMKYGHPTDFGIWVGRDGSMCALKILNTEIVSIPKKYKKDGSSIQIPQRAWRMPEYLTHWAKTHETTPDIMLCNVFSHAVDEIEGVAWSMIRVHVEKNNRHAVFSVDVHRMPYFFQDRDIQLTERGVRKPIFHLVRPHQRANGSVAKMHFRGSREFTWAGYNVSIKVPGRDHYMVEEFDIGSIDSFWVNDDKKMIGEPEFGRRLRKHLDGKPFDVAMKSTEIDT